MKKLFQKFLIAGSHNNFKPHLFTEGIALAVIAIFVGILSLIHSSSALVFKTGMFAEVYPVIVTSLANEGRKEVNVPELTYNKALEAAATMKVNDMIAKNYFAHVGPGGKQPWNWIDEAGYYYQYAGENLAINYSDSIDVHRAWMNSPTHRANILNRNFNEIGVAVATTTINGRESTLVVEMFGRQMNSARKPAIISLQSTSTATTSHVSVNTPSFATVTPTTTEEVLGTETEFTSFAETSLPQNENTEISEVETMAFGAMTSPNMLSMCIYVLFVILISFAAMALGFAEYHKHHKKSIFIAVLIFIAISVITVIYIGYHPEVMVL